MFLTGIADAYFSYDVTRDLAYGFSFDTKNLLEMFADAISTGAAIIDTILGIF